MPSIQVAEPQVGQITCEANHPADQQPLPRLDLAGPERWTTQLVVEQADRDHNAPERGPVVDHEVDDAAPVFGGQDRSRHAEESFVVRDLVPGPGQDECESAGGDKPPSEGLEGPLADAMKRAGE